MDVQTHDKRGKNHQAYLWQYGTPGGATVFDFRLEAGFSTGSAAFLEDGAYPFMVPVLKNFILPHAKPIAFLVAYGELAIGIALVLGILVRPA